MSFLRRHGWQLAGLVVALVVVVVGKQFYRTASPGDLTWILAPTARSVSLLTHSTFVYEAGAGWIDRDQTFIIAAACAGVNFAIAAFLVITFGWLGGMRSARTTIGRLAGAAAVAYLATIMVNTLRIAIALALHRGVIDIGDLDRAEVHRDEGIVIYLAGLCALYALARALTRTFETRRNHDVVPG